MRTVIIPPPLRVGDIKRWCASDDVCRLSDVCLVHREYSLGDRNCTTLQLLSACATGYQRFCLFFFASKSLCGAPVMSLTWECHLNQYMLNNNNNNSCRPQLLETRRAGRRRRGGWAAAGPQRPANSGGGILCRHAHSLFSLAIYDTIPYDTIGCVCSLIITHTWPCFLVNRTNGTISQPEKEG